jgi:triphosphoribosyl-dephospho-CoA synthase
MPGLSESETAAAFLAACRAELAALKPGNVHIHAAGHDMEAAQFEASAEAAAPWIARADLSVGQRILGAVEASLAAASCNTNLGILLLTGPLAAASQRGAPSGLRERLAAVLAALTVADAAEVFAAIRRASPGGLGTAADQDVGAEPAVNLREAMGLAADRDRIARAYVTDFEDIFAFGLPELKRARAQALAPDLAVSTLHMAYLARFPDSHLARKFGIEKAEEVRAEAAALRPLWYPVVHRGTFNSLLDFDADLKRRGLNPGTTADFVVATLFAAAICG